MSKVALLCVCNAALLVAFLLHVQGSRSVSLSNCVECNIIACCITSSCLLGLKVLLKSASLVEKPTVSFICPTKVIPCGNCQHHDFTEIRYEALFNLSRPSSRIHVRVTRGRNSGTCMLQHGFSPLLAGYAWVSRTRAYQQEYHIMRWLSCTCKAYASTTLVKTLGIFSSDETRRIFREEGVRVDRATEIP